jgi:hypothetical protein
MVDQSALMDDSVLLSPGDISRMIGEGALKTYNEERFTFYATLRPHLQKINLPLER